MLSLLVLGPACLCCNTFVKNLVARVYHVSNTHFELGFLESKEIMHVLVVTVMTSL